ncbi:MAG: cystathionine beta-synthase [Acidobacteria bacterium]|nr:cystathionine beta-synthase [Acidobacteriota bacterium]
MKYYNNLSELIGNTPLVKLNKVTDGIKCTVLAKVEYFNPGGSIKDRIAERLIDAAEASGKLKPGGTIVEPTSGNTGIGIALIAQQRGYKCIFTLPDKVAQDKIDTLKAYGAEVVVCPSAVSHEDPRSYYSVSDRLAREIPGAFKPDQYSNLNGPLSHYATTGPEIWKDTEGKVTHVVIGVGTGGTVSGTGKYLKEVSRGAVKVIGCDPAGSVYSNGNGRPYLVEGVGRGDDFLPEAYDGSVVDQLVPVPDIESFMMTRRLAKEEGLLVGPSCGMAVSAALKVARDLPEDSVVVVILPDGGRGYLAKVFNDTWMRTHGFMPRLDDAVEDLLSGSVDKPDLVRITSTSTISDALATGSDVVVVFDNQPPVRIGEVMGVIRRENLLDLDPNSVVVEHLEAKPPLLGCTDTIAKAREVLTKNDCALVLREGEVLGLLTRAGI